MGLFDFFNTDGALNQQQNTMGPPTYNQMMTQMTDPRQMDTGMKLQMLGRAFKGEDVSGSIQDYQDGIRNRFRQRQQDQRQSRIDDLNRQQTQLNMQNTQQNMDIANQKLPGQLRSQDLSNQSTDIANVRNSQLINQNNVGKAEWVGDNQTGRVMQLNPNTGALEDVTDQYTPAQIAAFKAAKNPAKTSKNTVNPGTGRVLSAAELERDKQFGKNIEKFNPTASSGNIGMLRMIADGLATQEPGEGNTGLSWMTPFKSAARLVDRDGDMGLRAIVDSESLDTQELVAGVIQKNLRETLGAQFTQREGMLLIQRAYNPQLDPKTNSKRLQAAAMLAEAYVKAQQNKLDYYNTNNGSIAGYNPQMENGLAAMENQVRQIFAQNGGDMSGGAGNGAPQLSTSEGVAAFEKYNTQ